MNEYEQLVEYMNEQYFASLNEEDQETETDQEENELQIKINLHDNN